MPHATKTRGSATHSGGSEHFDLCHFTLDSAADVCFALQIFLLTKVSDSAVKHEAEAPILEISPVSPNSEEANMVAIGQEVNVFFFKNIVSKVLVHSRQIISVFTKGTRRHHNITGDIFHILQRDATSAKSNNVQYGYLFSLAFKYLSVVSVCHSAQAGSAQSSENSCLLHVEMILIIVVRVN